MEKTNLLDALRICRPALGGDIIPGLTSFHFTNNSVSAFNGNLLITAELNFEFPVTGSIEGETLYKLINGLDKNVELEKHEDSALLVKSGRSKALFPVEQIDLAMLGELEESEEKQYLPTALLFASGIKRCLTSIGGKGIPQDEIGIHVFVEDGKCKMYSTNAITFSRFIFPLEGEVPNYEIFLPAAFSEQLLFMYSELGVAPQEIVASEKYIRARFDKVTMRSSFYANSVNLKLKQILDEGIESPTLVDIPDTLMDALKRCEVIAGNNAPVILSFGEEGKLYLKAAGSKNQRFYEEIDLDYPTTGSLKIDIKNLKKTLESCKEMSFGDDFLLLIGQENLYDYIITSYAE